MIASRDTKPENASGATAEEDTGPALRVFAAPDVARWSYESEVQVLGGVLLDPSTLVVVSAIVAPADFYHPKHAAIFEAIQSIEARGEPIDVVTVRAELTRRRRINTVGSDLISDITDSVVTVAHIEHHARAVRDAAVLRRLRDAAVATIGKVDDPSVSGEKALEFGHRRLVAATQTRAITEAVPLQASITAAFERMEATLARGSRVTGRSTGFRDLDVLLAGLHPEQLIIIAARPAMGKTSLGLDIATAVARGTAERPGAPVLFLSYEMAHIELTNRLLCGAARVDGSRLRSNMLTQQDMTALTAAAGTVWDLPLYIVDGGEENTLAAVKAHTRKFTLKHGPPGLIVVDYLQLMGGDEDSREREIASISRGLKLLAKETGCPVAALSQLNRDLEKRPGKKHRPQLSDLRESGAIEQDADVVIFIYRDEVYNRDSEDKGIAEIIVAKQRNGPTDTVRLRFVRELTRFENLHEDDDQPSAAPVDPGPVEPDRREPRQATWSQEDF